jgi:hypothetical protein
MSNVYYEALKRGAIKGAQETPAEFFLPVFNVGRLVGKMFSYLYQHQSAAASPPDSGNAPSRVAPHHDAVRDMASSSNK